MKRKTIFLRYCFVIFVVFLMTLALNTAIAETNSKYFSYSINSDNSINISGYAGNKSKITVPQIIDGHKVVGIDPNAFYRNTKIKNVTLPDTIITIGEHAFAECTSLKTIKLSSNLRELNGNCFQECTSLKSITFPNSLLKIGTRAFDGCKALESVIWDHNSMLSEIDSFVFHNCKNIREIKLPDRLKAIGRSAFQSCTSLTQLELPNNVETIGVEAFRNCNKLQSITIPDSVRVMEGNPFGKLNTQNVIISKNHPHFKIVDDILFDKNDNLIWYPYDKESEIYTVPYGTTEISEHAIQYGPKKVILPDTVIALRVNSLTSAEEVIIPESVKTILNPFSNQKVTLYVKEGSYAHKWAIENNVNCIVEAIVLPTPEPIIGTGKINRSSNVRDIPDKNGNKIIELSKGTKINIHTKNGEWYEISTTTGKTRGWVMDYVVEIYDN